jgi:hypothetical protein
MTVTETFLFLVLFLIAAFVILWAHYKGFK